MTPVERARYIEDQIAADGERFARQRGAFTLVLEAWPVLSRPEDVNADEWNTMCRYLTSG